MSEEAFGALLVPLDYDDANMVARGRNFIERRPACGSNAPKTGIHPSVADLNILLGRAMYNVSGLSFKTHMPPGKRLEVACVHDLCAEYDAFVKIQ